MHSKLFIELCVAHLETKKIKIKKTSSNECVTMEWNEKIEGDAASGSDMKFVENGTSQRYDFEDERRQQNEQPTDKKCWITINLFVYVQSTRSMSPMSVVHLWAHSQYETSTLTHTHTHIAQYILAIYHFIK